MDLNRLYFDHQLSLIAARSARDGCTRHGHEAAARRIAGAIGAIQQQSGAAAASAWSAQAVRPGTAISATLSAQCFAS